MTQNLVENWYFLENDDTYTIVFYSPSLSGYLICGSNELQDYGEDDKLTPVKFPDED